MFRSRLRARAETLDIRERQQILRLLVKEILVDAETITIRHSFAIPPGPESNGMPNPSYIGIHGFFKRVSSGCTPAQGRTTVTDLLRVEIRGAEYCIEIHRELPALHANWFQEQQRPVVGGSQKREVSSV